MGDIKSAFEIAMEKVEKIGKASDEELTRWKYTPEGEKLGARYLKEDFDIIAELNQYDATNIKYISDGAISTLVHNISLPKNETAKKLNKRAMEGVKLIKKDKVKVENIFSQVRRLFNHYNEQGEQQRQQAFQQVKAAFEAKIQQALMQQTGSAAGIKIDVEKHPQFQEEWRKVQNQLDQQYLQLLNGYLEEIMEVA